MWSFSLVFLPNFNGKEFTIQRNLESQHVDSINYSHLEDATLLLHHEKISLLLFALVILPLMITLILQLQAPKSTCFINYLAQLLQPIASACLAFSFYFERGSGMSIILSIGWTMYCLLISWMGLIHAYKLFQDSKVHRHHILICSGLFNMTLASLWVVLSRGTKSRIP